jgi:hypothetical protein
MAAAVMDSAIAKIAIYMATPAANYNGKSFKDRARLFFVSGMPDFRLDPRQVEDSL